VKQLGPLIVLVGVLFLALPALVTPIAIQEAIVSEDACNAAYLGEAREAAILTRTAAWLATTSNGGSHGTSPLPQSPDPLTAKLNKIGEGLMQAPYFEGLRALWRLVVFRSATATEWCLLCLPFIAAAAFDGGIMRAVKARTLVHHSPVLYGIGLYGSVAIVVCVLLTLVVPASVHPLIFAALLLLFGLSLGIATSNFHRVR
jgi:hypothetical protein